MDSHQWDESSPSSDVLERLAGLAEDISALVADMQQLRRDQEADRSRVEQLHLVMDPSGPPLDASRIYPDWRNWVDEWLVARVSRSPQRHRWCHRYDEHPEAADRLEALWVTWERAWPRVEARLFWFRDHLDHHLAVLTAEDGPMRNCSAVERSHAGFEPASRSD